MEVRASATSLSWIPSEAVTGPTRASFDLGVTHYDAPPPDALEGAPGSPARRAHLEALRESDAFRFANDLTLSAEFDGDRLVDHSVDGGIIMGATTVRVAKLGTTFAAVPLPDLRGEVTSGPGWVRATQTVGGRTALPLPRPVRHPPFVKMQAPIVWTTLALTLHADGSSEVELAGASAFPRHWVYDTDGRLVQKTSLAAYKDWLAHSFGKRTPWGDQDSPVIVTAAESALERELSSSIMRHGSRPEVRTLAPGDVLAAEGEKSTELYLVLDGVVTASVGGESLAELGPGAVVGERSVLEGNGRTSTLTASTKLRVAVASADAIDLDKLRTLADSHRRENGS
jgi:cyclic nucleotide-binding protein